MYKSLYLQARELKFRLFQASPMMAQPNQSPCPANPAHGNHKPTYFCLHPDCTHSRLLCYLCLKDPKHQGHKIAFINANVEPLSRLSSHCHLSNAKQLYTSLSKKALALSQSLRAAEKLATCIFDSIRKHLLDPIWTITNTYSKEMSEQAVQMLEKDPPDAQEIQSIAAKISYLLNINDSIEGHLTKADIIQMQAKSIIIETNSTLKRLFENIKKEVAEAGGQERSRQKNIKYQKYLAGKAEKTIKEMQESVEKEESSKHLDKYVMNKLKESLEMSSKLQDQKMDDQKQEPLNTRSRDRKKLKTPEKQVEYHEKKKPGRKPGPKPKKKQEEIEGENPSFKLENEQDPEYGLNQTLIFPDMLSRHSNNKESEPQESQDEQQDWIEYTVSADQNIEELSPLTLRKIRSVKVEGVPSQPSQLFRFIEQLKHLRELHIFDNLICEQQRIIQLMQCLPRSLRKLYFNCSNEFNRNCITALYKKKLKHLTHLQYFYNIHQLFRRVDQSLYFRDKAEGVRVEPLDFSDTHYMASCFPQLKNLWIRVKNYNKNRRKNTVRYQQLEDLIVGELEEEEIDKRIDIGIIPAKLNEHLMETYNLRCLVLLSVQFQPEHFVKIVLQNQHLETLYLELCIGPTEKIMERIGKESKIKNFAFKECLNITGSFIQQLPDVESFILDHLKLPPSSCPLVSPYTSFELCHSLNYLNVYANPFFNDSLFATLENSFSSFRSLNFGYTLITDTCAPLFKQITQLECLCLDENLITAEGIYDICSSLSKLEKLSLCGFNGEKGKGELSSQLLNDLGRVLPNLKHMSLRNCCIIGEDFNLSDFRNLKIVETDSKIGEHFISTLKFGGVKVYDESQEDI